MSGINCLLEWIRANAAICFEKVLAVLPQADIGVDDGFNGIGHRFARETGPIISPIDAVSSPLPPSVIW